jgi:hypothetical protein
MVVLAEEGLEASRRSARSRRRAVQSGVALAVYPALAPRASSHVGHRGAPAVGTKAPTMRKPAEPVNGSETPSH